MPAKIEVFSKPLTGLSNGPDHMYIIYTNEAGVKNILRGGPEGSSFKNAMIGDIAVEDLPYAKFKPDGTPQLDWDEYGTHIGQEIFTGTDAEMYAKIDLACAEMNRINSEGYDYNLPVVDSLIQGWGGANDQNSNTVVARLAEVMGLKPLVLNFISTNNLNVPGYDATLEHSDFERTVESIYQGLKDAGHTVSELWSDVKNSVGNTYEGVQDFFFGLFAREGEVIVGPLQQADNSLLNLEINTNNPQSSSNHNNQSTQTGNVIGDGRDALRKQPKRLFLASERVEAALPTLARAVFERSEKSSEVFYNSNSKQKQAKQIFVLLVFCFGFFLQNSFASNLHQFSEKECLELTDKDTTYEKSTKRILKLKKVSEFNTLLKKNKSEKISLIFFSSEPKYINNKCFWYFRLEENHKTHLVFWKSFLVDINGIDIYEENAEPDSYSIVK